MFGLSMRILTCFTVFGLCLYAYLNKQNELTQIRLRIPQLVKEIKEVEEENSRLLYEINRFENPKHLMQLASNSEFSHLKYPLIKDILTLPQGVVMQENELIETAQPVIQLRPILTLASGANQ